MYKGLLALVRALQLVELKLSGSMANIEQNSILYFWPLKMYKSFYFLLICLKKTFEN